MIGLLILCAAVFTGIGIYHLSCALIDVPTARTSKTMMRAKKQTGTGEEKLFDVYVSKLAVGLSRFVKLDPVKKNRLQTTLAIAGIHLTPESYTLKAYITALAVALPALPCFTFMPLFGFLLLGLAVMMWFATYYEAFDLSLIHI